MIELLTVLVIIGVLMSISMVAYGNVRERARLARVKSNVGEIALSLDDFSRDHNARYPALTEYHRNLPPSGSYATTPAPPSAPQPGVPATLKWRGNAIIGGGPGLVDTGNPLQDDFYKDMQQPQSMFRERQGEMPWEDPENDGTPSSPMHPVDALALNGHFESYPLNPLAGPGVPMVNIAHFLYLYDAQSNDFQWVTFTIANTGEQRTGVCAARPYAPGVYEPIEVIWDEDSYPQGDFAYIPFEFTNEQGTYCNGYWIISYGNVSTLRNSDYNKYALDQFGNVIDPAFANWPNLPPPYGDGIPTTPPDPVQTPVEYQIKRLIYGALDVRATIFEDQFATREHQ
jgi:type II secretory pathway pseudopilin PulG